MEADLSRRVVKVTLELADGETQTYAIHDNDGVMCLMVSKEQNFLVSKGYCGAPSETGIALLDELVQSAKTLEQAIRLDRWEQNHRN
jgi:hypothetical protein